MKRLLDLFCGAGGASMGYYQGGFTDITGVDIRPQPRYPFSFIQGDAMEWLRREDLTQYDLIHASPPCQAYSELVPPAYRALHPDLLEKTLTLLRGCITPYIVENVAGARGYFKSPIVLCGSMFGLPIQRHRWFEIGNSNAFFLLPPCNHSEPPILVSGRGMRKINGVRRKDNTAAEKYAAMGIDWMNSQEIEEAIPPAYSKFLAEQL